MKYHLIPVKMAIIEKDTNNECWRGCGEKVTLVHCWWECKLVQPLWKTVWRFLKKLKIEVIEVNEFLANAYRQRRCISKQCLTSNRMQ